MKRQGKILSGILSLAMIIGLIPSTVFADTTVYTAGTYMGTSTVKADEDNDFDDYELTLALEVDEAGIIQGLNVTPEITGRNKKYVNRALTGEVLDAETPEETGIISQVTGKSVDTAMTMEMDAVSSATCSSAAMKDAVHQAAAAAAATKTVTKSVDTVALAEAIESAKTAEAPDANAYTEESIKAYNESVAAAIESAQAVLDAAESQEAVDAANAALNEALAKAKESLVEKDAVFVTMNIPFADYYASEGVTDYVDIVTTATSNKFASTTGLAKGTYNNGESILGVTAPVKMAASAYAELKDQITDSSASYYFTVLEEEPAVYKELTYAEGSYAFSAAAGAAGDASSITVSEAYGSRYGNYQIDLEGVLTAGGVTINGETQTISGMILETSAGNFGLACLENYWLGTRVTDVEVAFSAEGATVLTNHGGLPFKQFAGLNGATVNGVKIITDKGIYNVSCSVALKPYYTGTVSAIQTGEKQITLKGLPSDLENGRATVSYSYQEEGQRRPTTVKIAEDAEIVNGVVETTEALDPERTYTVTIASDNYSDMTATVTVADQETYYVTMNVPFDEYYAAEGVNDYVDVVTTATSSKFKGTTGLAKGTYNNGESILGVTAPVKMDRDTYLKMLTAGAGESDDYYFTNLEEEPAVFKTLTLNEDGSCSFSAAEGAAGDASSITVSEAYSSRYGNYQIDLEGVLTAGGVTINGETQTISGMILETSAGNFGLACLENYWLGTRVTDVEVAFSAEGATVLTNHGGLPFKQFAGLNGATVNGVKIITDKGIYNVSCSVALKPYYTGTVSAIQTGEKQITLKGLPSDLENGRATVSYSYQEEGQRRPTTVKIAEDAEIVNGVVETTEALDPERTYTVTIASDNYSDMTATVKVPDQEAYYVTMNVPFDEYYAAEGVNDYVDVVTTATTSKFKGTTGLAKGTYNNGESILGVTAPVKMDRDTYLKMLMAGTVETDDYYFTDLGEEPAVYKTLTLNEDGSCSFSAAEGAAGDASSITVSEAYSSRYGNYQIDLEGVLTAGGVTINGETQTISGMILETSAGNFGLACLENYWLGTRVTDVEVAFSAEGATVLTNHGGLPFKQFAGLNGATVNGVKIITDKGIYNVSCSVALKPYYTGTINAIQTGDNTILMRGLPSDLQNGKATVSYSYREEGQRRPTTVMIANAADIADGVITTDTAIDPAYTYTVTIDSDNYSPMSTTLILSNQETYYVTMNVPFTEYYAAEGTTQSVDIVTTATANKFKGTTGLAKGTYNNGESILGVTTPVKMDKDTFMKVVGLGAADTENYYYTILDEEPAVYKTLTISEDGTYSFGAAEGTAGDASSITVSEAYSSRYGNYQIDLQGVLTAGGVTINGETQTISGMILETSAGNFGLACLENFWLGTRVTDVEVAFSAEGAPVMTNHGGLPFKQFAGLNGATVNGVKIITDKGIYNVPCGVALKPYFTGTVTAAAENNGQVSVSGLPENIDNAVMSVYYTEGTGRNRTTVYAAENVPVQEGKADMTNGLIGGKDYTVTINSDNYSTITAPNTVTGVALTELSDDGKTIKVSNLADDLENPTVTLTYTNSDKETVTAVENAALKDGAAELQRKLDGGVEYQVVINSENRNPVNGVSVSVPVTITSAEITEGSKEDVKIVCNRLFDDFTGIRLDGKDLDSANYKAVSGSTEVTFAGEYTSTLAKGVHNVEFLYKDGSSVPTTLTVNESKPADEQKPGDTSDDEKKGESKSESDPKSTSDKSSGAKSGSSSGSSSGSGSGKGSGSSSGSSSSASGAKTGDRSNAAAWAGILLAAVIAGIGAVIFRRKKASN